MDEVGFMVQNITFDGFLQFVTLGGWWEHSLLSQRVEILTRSERKILGVVSSRPPHFVPKSQRGDLIPIEQMFIDVGAGCREEVERDFGIHIGDPIAPVSAFTAMAREDYYMAKAFDNRVGMAAVIQCGQTLSGSSHPNRLILTGTVMEEVGLRGAKTAAEYGQPDVAIVLEGPPADDTLGFSRHDSQGALGRGVQIRVFDPTAIANPRLVRLAIEVAQEERIPYQVTVRRTGGTDAGTIHLSGTGVPSVVLGVPARYIHSHNSIIDLQDYLAMLALTNALVRQLDDATVQELTRFL
jgi:endoglucanase